MQFFSPVKGDSSTTLTTEGFPHRHDDDVEGPGLVMVFSATRPTSIAVPLKCESVLIGRKVESGVCVPLDSRMSRSHARLRMEGDRLDIVDLKSHNGTFVDGTSVTEMSTRELPRTLRVGDSVFIFVPEIGPFMNSGVQVLDGIVVGPTLAQARDKLAKIAGTGGNVLLTGPTGVGKELAARHFHASRRDGSGPLIAVNCAAIPPAIAERLLFGAQRGAYSGADANVDGFVQAAHGGTLFLDEIAELEPTVQAKLLRVVETKEVTALGATKAKAVQFQLCAATLKDLRGEAAAGRFREDLYHRVGRPEVKIPCLRERAEEIPLLALTELRRLNDRLTLTASFVEACLLRDWPGNVREFLRDMQEAAMSANTGARALLYATDLPTMDVEPSDRLSVGRPSSAPPRAVFPTAEEIVEALRLENGNVSSASRRLGVHRNQLRRWLTAQGLDINGFRDRASDTPPDPAHAVNATEGLPDRDAD